MLKRAIKNIRHKPKAVRDQYALWTAVIFTALVMTIWFVSLPSRFETVENAADEAAEPAEEPESFSDMLGGLRDGIQNLNQATTSPAATTTRPNATSTWGVNSVVNPTAASAVRIATFTASVASTTP